MIYTPYGEDWKKEMFKMNIKQLESCFGLTKGTFNKSDFIDNIRANLLVKEFNEEYKIGDKLLWKPVAAFGYTPVEVTVKQEAFLHYGNPVDLLIELGFKEIAENSETYFIEDSSIFENIIRVKKHPTLDGYMFVLRDIILCTLEYVHQFQNLYYSLTSNDLVLSEA